MRVLLPVLLDELRRVPSDQITLLNALGTHRANSPDELEAMLGRDTVRHYQVEQHDAWNTAKLADLGLLSTGHRLWVNRTYAEADVKILTGFIEPHLFCGLQRRPQSGVAGNCRHRNDHVQPQLCSAR